MQRIQRDQYVYSFSKDNAPVMTIDPGARIVAETWDSSTGRISKAEDVQTYLKVRDSHRVNPAAGPILVNGAEPGDELAVTIHRIGLTKQGFVRVAPGIGLLTQERTEHRAIMVTVDGDSLDFGGLLKLPARPMVGVIGTTPAEGVVYTGDPHRLGSNLDMNAVKVGATVHLPVEVPGALFAIGDVHAAMGDGEVTGTGVEIPAEIEFTVELVKGGAWNRVWIENDREWVTTGYSADLIEAVRSSVEDMCALVSTKTGISVEEAFMLFSATGDARVGQCAECGVDLTAYAVMPKAITRR